LDRQDAHRQALQSHLDDHHQQHLAIDELHQQKLSEVQLNQANISARQERLIYTSKQTEKRLVLLKEKVQGASQSSTKNHQETRGLLRDEFKRLQTSLSKNFVCAKRSGNEVYFRGERPDKIIGYLLPIKDELNTTINQILAQSHHGVPIQEMLVLREEFQRLLGSSAQAEAARYSMSTATSFDEWHFPGQEGGPGTSAVERRKCRAQECEEPAGTENIVYEPRQMRKRAKLKTQTLSFATHAGKLHLFISQREPKGDDTRNSCDLGLSFTSRAQSFAIVDILFARSFLHQTRPRICTHLNVSTLVPNSQINIYWQLFNANPTIKDVDHAIRHGSINPYHIDHMGTNMILFVSIGICELTVVLQLI
jgi:hypothetical protein